MPTKTGAATASHSDTDTIHGRFRLGKITWETLPTSPSLKTCASKHVGHPAFGLGFVPAILFPFLFLTGRISGSLLASPLTPVALLGRQVLWASSVNLSGPSRDLTHGRSPVLLET